MPNIEKAIRFNALLKDESLVDRLELIAGFSDQAVFETGFSREDQYLAWAIHTHTALNDGRSIEIVAPPSNALSAEQQALLDVTRERFGGDIVAQPTHEKSNTVAQFSLGIKTLLTSRTLETPSSGRPAPLAQWDAEQGAFIFNPLADMTKADVESQIFAHEIPVNLPKTYANASVPNRNAHLLAEFTAP